MKYFFCGANGIDMRYEYVRYWNNAHIIIIVGDDTLVWFFFTQISDMFAIFGGQSFVVDLTTFLDHICSIHRGETLPNQCRVGSCDLRTVPQRWLGNYTKLFSVNRGKKYKRVHVSLNPSSSYIRQQIKHLWNIFHEKKKHFFLYLVWNKGSERRNTPFFLNPQWPSSLRSIH